MPTAGQVTSIRHGCHAGIALIQCWTPVDPCPWLRNFWFSVVLHVRYPTCTEDMAQGQSLGFLIWGQLAAVTRVFVICYSPASDVLHNCEACFGYVTNFFSFFFFFQLTFQWSNQLEMGKCFQSLLWPSPQVGFAPKAAMFSDVVEKFVLSLTFLVTGCQWLHSPFVIGCQILFVHFKQNGPCIQFLSSPFLKCVETLSRYMEIQYVSYIIFIKSIWSRHTFFIQAKPDLL